MYSRMKITEHNLVIFQIIGQNASGRRIFVTSPRFTPGVPFTLSIITSTQNGESNLLAPFPDLQSQAVSAGCNSIISVDKIHVSLFSPV